MCKIKMTTEGLTFYKKHNIRIIGERDGKYGPHFRFEVMKEDKAAIVEESGDKDTCHTEGRRITIRGKSA